MAEGRNLLRIVRLYQDASGRITGGVGLYPPAQDGRKLNAREAQNVSECDSMDGFDVWQNNDLFYVTPHFGESEELIKVPVHVSDKSNAGALLVALLPLLDDAPKMGERTAVIYERPIEV